MLKRLGQFVGGALSVAGSNGGVSADRLGSLPDAEESQGIGRRQTIRSPLGFLAVGMQCFWFPTEK